MKETPLFLKLRGITAVVAGGGPVAARKVNALLRAGAVVTVVAPEAALMRRWRWADIRARETRLGGDLRPRLKS